MTSKFSRNFTISKAAWDWLNVLKYQQHINLSSYIEGLILADMKERKEKEKDVQ